MVVDRAICLGMDRRQIDCWIVQAMNEDRDPEAAYLVKARLLLCMFIGAFVFVLLAVFWS